MTVFTDHRNLLFTFHLSALEPSLGRNNVLHVILWALYPSAFIYSIECDPGKLYDGGYNEAMDASLLATHPSPHYNCHAIVHRDRADYL